MHSDQLRGHLPWTPLYQFVRGFHYVKEVSLSGRCSTCRMIRYKIQGCLSDNYENSKPVCDSTNARKKMLWFVLFFWLQIAYYKRQKEDAFLQILEAGRNSAGINYHDSERDQVCDLLLSYDKNYIFNVCIYMQFRDVKYNS